MTNSYQELCKKIGYSFGNLDYLKLALTHSSYSNEHKPHKRRTMNAWNIWGMRC